MKYGTSSQNATQYRAMTIPIDSSLSPQVQVLSFPLKILFFLWKKDRLKADQVWFQILRSQDCRRKLPSLIWIAEPLSSIHADLDTALLRHTTPNTKNNDNIFMCWGQPGEVGSSKSTYKVPTTGPKAVCRSCGQLGDFAEEDVSVEVCLMNRH